MPSTDAGLEIRTVANDPVPIRVRANGAWTFSGLKTRRDQFAHSLAEVRNHSAERVARDLAGMDDLDDAGAQIAQGNARAARPVIERALAILQESEDRVRKRDSPATYEALASLLMLEGRRREAREQLLNELRIREETLGSDHRLTAKAREALADLK